MNKRSFSSLPGALESGALKIAGIYLMIGSLWILFSDQIAARVALSEGMLAAISMSKGWVYVLITALLLYWLVRRHTTMLRASEKQLQRLIDALPALISYVGADRRYRFVNGAYAEWFEGDILGKHVEEVIGTSAYQSISKYIDKVLDGETVSYETEISLPDGERFISAIYVPDLEAGGQARGYFALIHDLTEQNQIRDELRQWAHAFEGCAHGIAVADPNTNRIIVCNPAFAKMHKSRVEDVAGSAILSLYAPSEYDQVRRNVQKADQIGHARFEAKMIRRDRSTFPVQMDIVSVLGEDGELLYRVATAQDISERKLMDEKLRESEARHRTLVEHLPAITYMSEPDQYIGVSYISPQIETLGFSTAAWLADPELWLNRIHPQDRERVMAELKNFKEGADTFRVEYRMVLPGGETKWFRDESVRIKNPDGRKIFNQGFMLDITERKQAEEVLRESEERYRIVSQLTSDYAYKDRVDEDGNITPEWMTESFSRITGYTSEEAGAPGFWQKFVHPDSIPALSEHIENVLSGQPDTREFRVITKSGQIRWLRDYSNPIWDPDQKRVVGLYGAVQDITEYKQAQEKVLLQARWLEQTNDAVINSDENLVITAWNAAAERIYGWKAEEVLGKRGEEVLRSEFFSKTRAEVLQELKETGEFSAEITQLRKDGSRIQIETRTVRVQDESGHVIGHISVNRDITERKRAEEENKSLARFPAENPNPVLRATHEGKIIYANAASAPLLQDWNANVGTHLPEDWIKLIGELIKTGSRKTMDIQSGKTTYSMMIIHAPDANDVNIYGRDITERRQAEEHLRRFKLLSEHSRDIILFVEHADGHILEANAAAVQAYGYSRDELLNLTIKDLRTSDTRELTASQMAQADAGGILFETSHRRKDGSTFPVEVSSQGATIGNVRALISIVRDITERKNAEKALTESEARFRSLFEQSADAILLLENGIFTDCNQSTVQLMHAEGKEEILLTHPSQLSPEYQPDGRLSTEKAEEMIRTALEKGSNRFEWIHRRMDGTDFPVEVLLTSISAGDQPVIHTVWRDITERKQIERELQEAHAELEIKVQERTAALSEANALLQALMDNIPDHIYFKDTQSRFIRNSRSQASLLGLSDPLETVGKTDFDFFPHAAKSYAEEQEVMRSGKPRVDFEEWVVWPDGRETWVSTTKMPLRNAEGETIGIFGISHDITERKRSEQAIRQLNADLERQAEQLQAANKELEAFSYSVSHDLRAPLRAIDGYTRILLEDYEPVLDEEGKRLCGVISREARRMGQLIDDLLAFSRLGRKEMYSSKIDMRGLAVSVLNDILKAENRERMELRIGKLPDVKGDSSLIRQVWVNLLANAIKFTSKKERAVIEVGSKTTRDEFIYYVRDNGAGFDMEYANKLFGVFQRLHSESEFSGTGVGLAIVQRIIRRHNGRVWAEGEVEKGATFYFALPRKENLS